MGTLGADGAMTPICHVESPPRVPGCEPHGKRPHDYGPGRICATPDCGTTLRRTHKGSVCDPCIYDAKARARATAREVPAPATTAAPAIRATKEEKVARTNGREVVLAVFMRDPSRCFNAGDVQKSCGISLSAIYRQLGDLVASDRLVKRAPGVYRLAAGRVITASLLKTAPATPPALDAPVIPPPERAAESASASDPPGNEPRMPVPFAGLDYELHVIGALISQIESLTGHETRVRVAAYVAARFL